MMARGWKVWSEQTACSRTQGHVTKGRDTLGDDVAAVEPPYFRYCNPLLFRCRFNFGTSIFYLLNRYLNFTKAGCVGASPTLGQQPTKFSPHRNGEFSLYRKLYASEIKVDYSTIYCHRRNVRTQFNFVLLAEHTKYISIWKMHVYKCMWHCPYCTEFNSVIFFFFFADERLNIWKKEKHEKLPNGKSDKETCRNSNRGPFAYRASLSNI